MSAHLARPGNYLVLLVDDDEMDRRHYQRLLMQRGLQADNIRSVSDGAAGLKALREATFDCVLLDFNLPDMTGLDFLAAATGEGGLPCAFVLVTGQGSEGIAVQAMKRGALDYLIKDHVSASSLWRAMTTAVTETELRQSLAKSHRELVAANVALASAKEAAEAADRAKTQFVAMVTHELRTPLNGILGYAQLLQAEGELTERQALHVDAMMRAGQHLLEMIQNVLDFASIESGRFELHPASIVVRELFEACLGLIQPQATARGLLLVSVVSAAAPGRLIADPPRLREVVLNLLSNAVKYTATGRVELRVLPGEGGHTLRIEVADTGPGVEHALRPRLFAEFERLTASISVEGTGLGLAIAARIVKQMEGEIGYSDNPGGGSVFWPELPVKSVQPSLPEHMVGRPSRLSWRILVVDDMEMNRDVISGLLRSSGHEVLTADDGQEALKLASDSVFDLILMDARMPGHGRARGHAANKVAAAASRARADSGADRLHNARVSC